MSRDQRSADELRVKIGTLTKMIADPNRTAETAKMLDTRRQRYFVALKILERKMK